MEVCVEKISATKFFSESEREGGRVKEGENCEFHVAILLQMKSAVLFSVVVEPCEFCTKNTRLLTFFSPSPSLILSSNYTLETRLREDNSRLA